MALIQSIDQLRKYVKINASKDFDTYKPFLDDAQEKYLDLYFGEALITKLKLSIDDPLFIRLCRALGPFSLALCTDELSINFGEAGHTVTRSETVAPASDAKIEKARASLFERAWTNLDKAIAYVMAHKEAYTEWEESDFAKKTSTLLFDNATGFHENGLVNIDYSPLTFYHLRMLILRIEKSETFMFVPSESREAYLQNISAIPPGVLSAMQAYTGSRVAALHTSQTTRDQQRGNLHNITEFTPLIRPLYNDVEYTGNYFDDQACFWKNALLEELTKQGVIDSESLTVRWNAQEKKIFVANAQRSDI